MPRHSYRERNYTFGQVMLKLRTSIGLTQAGLAALLGVSRRAIGEWETPSNYPKAEYLQHFLGLCVQQHVFAPRREEEEIRAFWKTAHQRVLLALPHQKSSFLLFKQTISHDCGSTGFVEETKLEYTTPQKGNRTMPKTQRTFTKEFKLEAVRLVQTSGKSKEPFEEQSSERTRAYETRPYSPRIS